MWERMNGGTPFLRRYLDRLGDVRGYGPALAGLGIAVALHFFLREILSQNSPAIFFLYLCAVVMGGWCGYGPGLLVVLLTVTAVPFLMVPDFSIRKLNPAGTAALMACSLLISHISRVRRQVEEQLRAMNEDLERRIAERTAELGNARDSLQTTLASIGDAVLTTDTQGRIVFANPAAVSLLGCELTALTGVSLDKAVRFRDEASRAAVENPVERTLRQGKATGSSGSIVLVAADGREIPIDENCSPIRSGDDPIEGAVLILRDASARRQAEATSRLLASIVESSEDAIISNDLNGTITSWNRGAEEIYGYSAAEIMGRPVSLLLPPDRAGEVAEILARIAQGHGIKKLQSERLTREGGPVSVSLTISPVYDALGRISGASKIARDITEELRAIEEARAARDSLRTTLASIGDAVMATDTQGRIVFANHVALDLLRRAEAEVLGRPLEEVFRIANEFTREPVENPVSVVMRERNIVGLANHTILLTHDGGEVPIDDSGSPIRNDRGEITGVVLTFRDVTERRRAEEALQAAQMQLKVVTDTMSAAVTRCSRDLRYIWASPQYARWVQSTPEQLAGRPIEEVLGTAGLSTIRPYIDRVLAGERVNFETRFTYPHQFPKYIRASYVPTYDRHGEVDGWVAHVSDLTDIKEAQAELTRVNANLEQTNLRLARSNEDLERFAFVASHDLQEPLRMVSTFAQLLVRTYQASPGSDAALFVDNIMDGTRRMRALLSDLLTYAEIGANANRTDHAAHPVDLNQVVRTAIENLRTAIESTGAVIEVEELPVVSATEGYLVPLFQNLFENAIKYRGKEPPRIRLGWKDLGGYPRFSVSDNGIGIEEEYHTQIFGVFKRLHSGKIPGTGVGLAICQRVVERYGGKIWVDSQPGEGATFRFTMPHMRIQRGEAG